MSALIQLARALSEKFTYEELKDYLNESFDDSNLKEIEFTLNGKKMIKKQLPRDQGVAIRLIHADGLHAHIITVPQGDIIGACFDGVVQMIEDMNIGGIDYEGPNTLLHTVNRNLMKHTHVKIPANGKLDLNKAFSKVNLKNFRASWKEDGIRF